MVRRFCNETAQKGGHMRKILVAGALALAVGGLAHAPAAEAQVSATQCNFKRGNGWVPGLRVVIDGRQFVVLIGERGLSSGNLYNTARIEAYVRRVFFLRNREIDVFLNCGAVPDDNESPRLSPSGGPATGPVTDPTTDNPDDPPGRGPDDPPDAPVDDGRTGDDPPTRPGPGDGPTGDPSGRDDETQPGSPGDGPTPGPILPVDEGRDET